MILYHGTGEVFSKPHQYTYFTDEYGVALFYAQTKASSRRNKARVLQCRVDVGNLVEVSAADMARSLTGREDYEEGTDLPTTWEWGDFDVFSRWLMRYLRADTLLVRGLKDMAPEDHSGVYNQFVVASGDQVTIINESCVRYTGGSLSQVEYIYPEEHYEQHPSRQRVQLPALAA